ncbi:hypothetical protein LUZ61_004818 [Rhynchospora tenuis]|uniref:Reverse transcriptase zinc-binding domain-containing protein n=1 Tax=Rhynchospora tenuis TaxID=198213 RepID=A0AAD6EU13_9POAL|nr:hypothetical protein LUZ61_004818 [Rhynchospora tenuis]
MAWNHNGSFFWKQLMAIRPYFQLSVKTVLRGGQNSLFWYDSWADSSMVFFAKNEAVVGPRAVSVAAALRDWFHIVPAPMTLLQHWFFTTAQTTHLTSGPDTLIWKWSSQGQYSSNSLYKRLVSAGKTNYMYKIFWKFKITPTVKVFLVLLSHRRILTQDQLLRRNINVQSHCHLCQQDVLETADHIFCSCPFTVNLWTRLNLQQAVVTDLSSLLQYLISNNQATSYTATLIATALWGIWLERNNRVFRSAGRSNDAVHNWIVQEASLFWRFS